ncbi:N-formylglutamate amidohydrolase [Sphingomonas sabuli]|uniref:N-formylglutamate amidohydrolase n=1 Tax=Sphingomonas sabuli TaxID=2764186 RepID=A0A7G9L2J9_9SPHN|nr:N-formylglutamate amidohydrolase [Sphingomonas sabuli]QNM82848.1 N-formylglutamate amidohydrolase [Sphingomonas sabuli]
MTESPLALPIVHPPRGRLPVLLSVPHAGRDYPDWLIAEARHGLKSLQPLEDPFVDRLVWRALGHGVGAVIAATPRAAVDCNRAEDEVDPALVPGFRNAPPSVRARGGLGIVPSRTLAHGHLWRRRLSNAALDRRLETAYRPYHAALERQLADLAGTFGCALLLDCHSMPPSKCGASVVFGDRYGRSAAPWLMSAAVDIAKESGFVASVNDPFAGGHILDRHAAPQSGVHAIQVEIDRRCYLTAQGEPGAQFDAIADLLESLTVGLGELLLDRRLAAAAE